MLDIGTNHEFSINVSCVRDMKIYPDWIDIIHMTEYKLSCLLATSCFCNPLSCITNSYPLLFRLNYNELPTMRWRLDQISIVCMKALLTILVLVERFVSIIYIYKSIYFICVWFQHRIDYRHHSNLQNLCFIPFLAILYVVAIWIWVVYNIFMKAFFPNFRYALDLPRIY